MKESLQLRTVLDEALQTAVRLKDVKVRPEYIFLSLLSTELGFFPIYFREEGKSYNEAFTLTKELKEENFYKESILEKTFDQLFLWVRRLDETMMPPIFGLAFYQVLRLASKRKRRLKRKFINSGDLTYALLANKRENLVVAEIISRLGFDLEYLKTAAHTRLELDLGLNSP